MPEDGAVATRPAERPAERRALARWDNEGGAIPTVAVPHLMPEAVVHKADSPVC